MIPSARLQAAIDVLDEVLSQVKSGGRASDDAIRTYFRTRRYAGSKDRRAVGELVYGILRDFERTKWALGEGEHDSRAYFITHLALSNTLDETLFTGEGHGPSALGEGEKELALKATSLGEPPLQARTNCPTWLLSMMEDRFKGIVEDELMALNERAPLDLRINTQKFTQGKALDLFLNEHFERSVTNHSPQGVRLPKSPTVTNLKAYSEGFFEVQDEAAQIASLLTGVKPGNTVIDLCAGGGGKSLAMANIMENKGVIHAFDINEKRLKSLGERAKRASAKIVKFQHIEGFDKIAERSKELDKFNGKADVVVLDVPCSGTGTWRRSPELRLRLTEERLTGVVATQKRLMKEGAKLLKPGGRLIYMTCSILEAENEAQIATFLKTREPWRLMGAQKMWVEVLGRSKLKNATLNPKCLQLTPYANGTDGFFVGIIRKPS